MVCVGASFLCSRCLYILYGRRVLAFASFPIYGDENTIPWSCWPCGAACLDVLRVVGRPVVRLVCRLVVRPVGRRLFLPRRRGRYRSSSGHRFPAACLSCRSPRSAVPVVRWRCSRFVLCGCRDACRIVCPMGLAAACCGGVLVLVMLFVLACLAIPYRHPPRPIDKPGGAMLRRSGGVLSAGASHRRGFLVWFCLPSYPYRLAMPAMWRDGMRTD